ncbi:MAG: 50S ribosomal protein L31 [Candidatus Blackburnbacteria bacterium RIFCSPHIGHO2_01_FULL_43_15b]|uniref:Large ribosomal subunit protein bL31 n=1 Tax=Candidatus Blackburnbacteria bacterium RIFCSPHIGHO2_01_FULL_43_15b TaxID=1797513 RepID=A0A1G1UXD2_9BACT|nr:MAG: 50S ribosomal protein L31 [Candidatus Blackburnbacteria bacterium RIFCSPHIGHO2_01_FULL_43_15b]
MRTAIHPKYYPDAQVTCACGNKFIVGSTVPEIRVEICSSCHPFYTGQMKYVDTAGRVDRFRAQLETIGTKTNRLSKKERRHVKRVEKIQTELSRPNSLEELRTAR